MLTTRQLVNMMEDPCREGLAFADAHPDPEEAISYALAHAETNWEETDAFGDIRNDDPGAFLRWAASDEVVGEEDYYYQLGWFGKDIKTHLESCARILREWVAKMQAKHEVRS